MSGPGSRCWPRSRRPGLAEVTRWHDRAAALANGLVPDPDTEYLMWQTLAGAWPLDRERLTGYLVKAMREAKTRTSWTDPDAEYESMVLSFAEQVLDDDELTSAARPASWPRWARTRGPTRSARKLVQLTMPGVADTYQGCELAGLALVDPDNRRPADFTRAATAGRAGRRARPGRPGLARSCWSPPLPCGCAGRTRTGSRRAYQPLAAEGPAAGHAVAFARGRPSPWPPGCPPACAAAAAGPAPCCRCPPARTRTCSPAPRIPARARCSPRLPNAIPWHC